MKNLKTLLSRVVMHVQCTPIHHLLERGPRGARTGDALRIQARDCVWRLHNIGYPASIVLLHSSSSHHAHQLCTDGSVQDIVA